MTPTPDTTEAVEPALRETLMGTLIAFCFLNQIEPQHISCGFILKAEDSTAGIQFDESGQWRVTYVNNGKLLGHILTSIPAELLDLLSRLLPEEASDNAICEGRR